MMEYDTRDLLTLIGELHYRNRLLEEELAEARKQGIVLLAENESAKHKMEELEAKLNGAMKERPVVEDA